MFPVTDPVTDLSTDTTADLSTGLIPESSRFPDPRLVESQPRGPAAQEQYEPEGEFRTRQPAWWAQARCNDGNGTLTPLFFSEQLDDIALAKAICGRCPAAEPCLEGAIARREAWGVWGGHIILKGKVIPTKRKRGRPPKHRPVVDPVALTPVGPLIAAAMRAPDELREELTA